MERFENMSTGLVSLDLGPNGPNEPNRQTSTSNAILRIRIWRAATIHAECFKQLGGFREITFACSSPGSPWCAPTSGAQALASPMTADLPPVLPLQSAFQAFDQLQFVAVAKLFRNVIKY